MGYDLNFNFQLFNVSICIPLFSLRKVEFKNVKLDHLHVMTSPQVKVHMKW